VARCLRRCSGGAGAAVDFCRGWEGTGTGAPVAAEGKKTAEEAKGGAAAEEPPVDFQGRSGGPWSACARAAEAAGAAAAGTAGARRVLRPERRAGTTRDLMTALAA